MQHLSWRACRQATPAVFLLRAQFQQRTVGMGEAPVLHLLFHRDKFTAARREGHKYLRGAVFGRKTQLSQNSYSLEVPSPVQLYSCRGVRMGMVPYIRPSRAMLYRTIQCLDAMRFQYGRA